MLPWFSDFLLDSLQFTALTAQAAGGVIRGSFENQWA